MNQVYLIPTYTDTYDEYGFGSWLSGAASGAATGASVGSIIPGWGTAIGAVVGGAAGLIKGITGDRKAKEAEEQAKKDLMLEQKNLLAQNRLQGIENSANIPTFAKGGSLSQEKAKQILRDGKVHGKPLTAAQKRFFGWVAGGSKAAGGHLPEGRATLKEAEEYIKQFPDEMKLGEEVEYEHTGNQKLAQRIAADHVKDYLKMTGTPGYYSAMKQAGISDELNKMEKGGYFEYKNGGIYIKPENKGKFTAWAKKHGMSVKEAANKVMANKEDYSPTTVKRANFAKNFAKELGGTLDNIPQLSFFQTGGVIPTVFDPSGYNKLLEVSGPVRRNYYPVDYRGGVSPEALGVTRDQLSNVDLTALTREHSKRTGKPLPEGYVGTVPATQDGYNYPMDEIAMQRYGAIPNLWQVSQKGKDYNYMLDSTTGTLSTPSMRQMRMASDQQFRNRMTPKEYAQYKGRQSQIKENGGILTEYKGGGTHEENPYGGIPVGKKAKVEEGEYRFDDPDTGESYIFSNRF